MENHVKTVHAAQINISTAQDFHTICVCMTLKPKTNALTMENPVISFQTLVANLLIHFILFNVRGMGFQPNLNVELAQIPALKKDILAKMTLKVVVSL